MATEAYDVVRSIKELVQNERESSRDKIGLALTAMQFAQTKKMQNIQLAGTQLDMLKKVNAQMGQSAASQFINDTGFGYLYSPTEDEGERQEVVVKAVKKLTEAPKINSKTGENTGGYGFAVQDANRIVSAMWAHKAGSNDEILSIADELNTKLSSGGLSASDDQFVTAFVSGGYLSESEYERGYEESGNLKAAAKTVENTKNIAAEMFEMGSGEFEIQRDISMGGGNLDAMVSEFNNRDKVDRVGGGQADVNPQIKEINKLNASVIKKERDKSLVEIELDNLTELSRANLASSEQLERLESIPLQVETFDEDINSLNEQIGKRNKDLSITAALAAKNLLKETQTKYGIEESNDIDLRELSALLEKYDPSVMEDVVAGKPGSIFLESVKWGGKLKDAPASDKFKLLSLAKSIDEQKNIATFKTQFQEDFLGRKPDTPGYRK